jgi:hypothetical protein
LLLHLRDGLRFDAKPLRKRDVADHGALGIRDALD